jgi:hypothetical protein
MDHSFLMGQSRGFVFWMEDIGAEESLALCLLCELGHVVITDVSLTSHDTLRWQDVGFHILHRRVATIHRAGLARLSVHFACINRLSPLLLSSHNMSFIVAIL